MVHNSLYLQHSQKPQNMGSLKEPTNIAEIKFSENKTDATIEVHSLIVGTKIKDLRFSAKASIPVIASLSYLTTILKGKPISAAFELTSQSVAESLQLPSHYHYCAEKSLEAIQKSLLENEDPLDKAFQTVSKYNGPYDKNQPSGFED